MQIVSMATFFFSGCQSAGVDYVHLQNHKEDNAGNIQGKATSQTVTYLNNGKGSFVLTQYIYTAKQREAWPVATALIDAVDV